MKYFMGIDAGTQGARIGIYDEYGKSMASGTKSWTTEYPQTGWAEQDPLVWWDAIMDILEDISKKVDDEVKENLETVCVDATSSTVLAVNKNGEPLTKAIMWMDIRATSEANAINSTNHKILDHCGGADSPEFFIPKVLWIQNNNPEIFESANVFCEQLDWINYKLSGKMVSSICQCTCKSNYVRSLGGYSNDFFNIIGFSDWENKLVKDVLDIGEPIGTVKSEITEKFGFNPNLTLLQGGIDAHIGMFGTNSFAEKKLCVILGTSFCHLCLTKVNSLIKGVWGPYEDAVIKDTWCLESGQATAAGLIQWFARVFNISQEDLFETLAYSVTSVPPGAEGLIMLDYFQGNRTPYKDPYARGCLYGLTMKHTWKHIYRSLLEAISFGTRAIIENLENQGVIIEEIAGCGGVTQDHPFMQIICDVTGKRIVVNKDIQGGVLGCAVIGAGVTCHKGDFQAAADKMVHPAKMVEPNMENHERYNKIYKKYNALYEATREIGKMQ